MAQQAGGPGWQALGSAAGKVPGGATFQFFPVQVGGPTPYAKSRRALFIGVSFYQLLMAIMALVEFMNFLSGMLMFTGCLVALWAFKEDMNITYVCWWGVMSFIGFVAGMVGALIGFAVKISTIVIKFNIPLSCFFGMVVAWWLYQDYENEHPESTDMMASWLRTFGLMKPKQALASPYGAAGTLLSNPMLSKSQLPQFGGAGNPYAYPDPNATAQAAGAEAGMFGASLGAAGASYGAMGQEQYAAMQAKAQQQGGFGNMFMSAANPTALGAATGFMGQAEGKTPTSGPLTGQGDLRRDPFMTGS